MSKATIDWAERRSYLGGSDMPSVLQVPGAFGTPLSVFLEKTGQVVDRSAESTYSQERGNALESFLLGQFAKRTGLSVHTEPCPAPRPSYLPKWWGGNIDAWTIVDGIYVPIECKSAGRFALSEWGEDGTDQVPLGYMVQTMHYAALLNDAPLGFVVSDIAGDECRIYQVPRVPAVIDRMLTEGQAFWDCVTLGIPPAPTSPAEAALRWPKASAGNPIEADQEVLGMVAALREARDAKKRAEDQVDALKVALQSRMQDHDAIVSGGRVLVAWPNVKTTRVDLDAMRLHAPDLVAQFTVSGSTRRFDVKKEKKS